MKNSSNLPFRSICILFLFLSGCTAKKEAIRIGVNSWPPCEIWYIAEEKGFFGKVPVELVRFSSWSDNMSSLYIRKRRYYPRDLFQRRFLS